MDISQFNNNILNERHLVIDLETVDLKPTAGILSIGAAMFIPSQILKGNNPNLYEFYANVDVGTCIERGMSFNWNTIYWWMKQSSEAGEALQDDRIHIEEALHQFGLYYFTNPPVYVWSNPNKFDISIIENAFNLCNMRIKWEHKQIMDLVTLENLLSQFSRSKIKESIKEEGIVGVPHNALYDAKVEVYRISRSLGVIQTCLKGQN